MDKLQRPIVRRDYAGAHWDEATETRFRRSFEKMESGCWLWRKSITPGGYGQFSIKNQHYAAHRLLYVKTNGDVGQMMMMDHLCRNRACVNPAHLEPVDPATNVRRGIAGALNRIKGASQTHCKNGHLYTDENTRRGASGRRCCRICGRASSDRWSRKRSEMNKLRTHAAIAKENEGG